MYCYDTITKETSARRLIDVWFARNERAEESMWTLMDIDSEAIREAADIYAQEVYLYYGARACEALQIGTGDLYYAMTQKFGFLA